MSLVKFEGSLTKPVWGGNNGKRRDALPKIEESSPHPVIDYEKLRWLCSIDGLKGKNQEYTTKDAHKSFMKNYRDIFVRSPKKLGFPIHAERRSDIKSSTLSITHKATGKTTAEDDAKKVLHKKEYPIDKITHDIRDYLPLLHKQRKSEHPEAVRADNIKTLRKLLRKLPFERTASDNDRIFSILKTFKFFQDNTPDNVLKELCVVAVFEQWKEVDFTVFGNTGLHMVLKGSVAPLTDPVLNGIEPSGINSRSATPLLAQESKELIKPGEFFGTLRSVEGREKGSKIFSVVTKEPNCEFLKISSSDYTRVVDRIEKREHTEKINLLLACGQFKLWPQQPLHQVAELFEWISYPPNTVLVSEGYKAPYIAFIKSGECHVLRQVEVIQTLRNLKREKRTKQVVMGKLVATQSFAEISVLLDEPITCSIVTATNVELGIIRPERITELDEVTKQLFVQSNVRTFGDLNQDDIQQEYIKQELKREWNEFKHRVVVESINAQGIRPGYGKWAK